MTDLRIVGAVERGPRVRIEVDGETVDAFQGETVASALLAAGIRKLRTSPVTGSPRGIFCYMGVCQECVVVVDGRRETSCSFPVADGLTVSLL